MDKDFELMDHTADIQVRVYGRTPEQFYRNALIALFHIMQPIIPSGKIINNRIYCPSLTITRPIVIHSIDPESLLVDFLSEALCLSDIYNEAYLDITIQNLTDKSIKGTLHGIPVEGTMGVEIKAITYHDLNIKKNNNTWYTDIVLDI